MTCSEPIIHPPGVVVPTSFLHGFRANEFLTCWNMCLQGSLASPDVLNELSEFGGVSSVRDIPIEELGTPTVSFAPTPRAGRFLRLAVAKAQGVDADDVAKESRILEMERVFERVRREDAPRAASRLSSIYLAESGSAGWNMIQSIKGPESFILDVILLAIRRLSRHDTAWLSRYDDEGEEAARGYWSGSPAGEEPLWEWLCEGAIQCVDADAVERLRKHVGRAAPPSFDDLMRALGIPRVA